MREIKGRRERGRAREGVKRSEAESEGEERGEGVRERESEGGQERGKGERGGREGPPPLHPRAAAQALGSLGRPDEQSAMMKRFDEAWKSADPPASDAALSPCPQLSA